MNLFESIAEFISGSKDNIEAPEGFCPSCWGYQEYGGKLLEAVKEERIDTNNLNEKKGWIQEYAITHFEGIKLRETNNKFECPTCKLTYDPS